MTNLIFPTLPTQDEIITLKGKLGIYETIDELDAKRGHVSKPKNPNHIGIKTSSELFAIAEKMKVYEREMEEYKVQENQCKIHNLKVESLILDFIKNEAGLNSIPEQYRNKVFSKAWSDGHSSGYYEVYQQLVELVKIFN